MEGYWYHTPPDTAIILKNPFYKETLMKRAIIHITPELLVDRLNLPKDIDIVGMFQTDQDKMACRYSIMLIGTNDKLFDVPEGCVIPIIDWA